MRIISKFRDYYDIGLSYGQDDDLIYIRKSEENSIKTPNYAMKIFKGMSYGYTESNVSIGQC